VADPKDFEELEEDVDVADPDLGEPKRCAVYLHNDNYTSMEFVIEVLVGIFKKSEDEATQIMLKVHTSGKAVAGIFVQEIAEMTVHQVITSAKARGFPLLCTTEPVDS
jgi:ATP-dependent Clp protease adaptor protein ClpS